MATAKDAAQWMVNKVNDQRWMDQQTVAYEIASKFGNEFTHENENGNLAIGKDVLREFRKLTEKIVVWDRGDKAWRVRETGDELGRQQGG